MDGSSTYCSGMLTKNYNSFPEVPEVLFDIEGKVHLNRKRQTLHQIYQNKCDVPAGVFGSAEAVTSEGVMA
jgi:diaminopimelate decarboxylase